MKKTIYVTPIIELIALIFDQIAFGENYSCPKNVIETYFIYVKNKLAPPEPGKVVSVLKLGKKQSPEVRNREYIKKPSRAMVALKTNNGEPLVGSNNLAGQAYMNICKRVDGEEVPFLDLAGKGGLFSRLFKKN